MTLPTYPDPDCVAAVALLKPRERDALILIGKGCRQIEVADRICASQRTVEELLTRARRKLQVDSTIEAAVMLAKAGLL